MSGLPSNPTDSVRKRNPSLWPAEQWTNINAGRTVGDSMPDKPTKKRIRQSGKPCMNKLEREWFDKVSLEFPNYHRPRAQSVTFKLANGVRYTPDVFACDWGPQPSTPIAWEVKGKKMWDDAMIKLKFAAKEWPEIRWLLVWKEQGQWKEQRVLP